MPPLTRVGSILFNGLESALLITQYEFDQVLKLNANLFLTNTQYRAGITELFPGIFDTALKNNAALWVTQNGVRVEVRAAINELLPGIVKTALDSSLSVNLAANKPETINAAALNAALVTLLPNIIKNNVPQTPPQITVTPPEVTVNSPQVNVSPPEVSVNSQIDYSGLSETLEGMLRAVLMDVMTATKTEPADVAQTAATSLQSAINNSSIGLQTKKQWFTYQLNGEEENLVEKLNALQTGGHFIHSIFYRGTNNELFPQYEIVSYIKMTS